MKALVTNHSLLARVANLSLGKSFGRGADFTDVPVPTISADEILVKVRTVALNPSDYKHIDVVAPPHSITGCDYAGEVTAVGANAAKTWKVGERVAGSVHGGLYPDRGAFAEYLKTDADLAWKIPAGTTNAQATTYGVSGATAALVLYARHGLPWPNQSGTVDQTAPTEDREIFIYAGSTSAGLFHIQLAKAAGYTVVTTASPHSFDLVFSYGADHVFSYRSPTVAEEIVKQFPNISKAVDCFSEGKSTDICASVLKNKGGKVVVLLDRGKSKTPGVEYELVMAYTAFGRAFAWLPPIGPKWEASPSDRKVLADFCAILPELTKSVKPLPTTALDGGFDAIIVGLNKLRAGEVSGSKLVIDV
ncbi:hypothetical protein AK830_g5564 [Neonectria ditissima]|uniref:Enoyl reductase (ER) domain-containing protein n=1 Tax=Neonectria ditissima TaxID=78410 RepID=A0A0P7AT33_9HYPO|nr:hypothetical protein AK830_g5564 [Neonectria ditissima]